MGFFDNIVKNIIGGKAADVIGDIVKETVGKVTETTHMSQNDSQTSQTSTRQNFPANNFEKQRKEHPFFADVIREEFSVYQMKEYIKPEELGGIGKPYNFGLYKNERLTATIMLTEHNRTNNAAFKNAKQACKNAGVPFINFFLHMPNERNYVIDRIKSFLP